MKKNKIQELQALVEDMYWEYDRVSSSGQKTLDKIADLVGVKTEAEMNEIIEKRYSGVEYDSVG